MVQSYWRSPNTLTWPWKKLKVKAFLCLYINLYIFSQLSFIRFWEFLVFLVLWFFCFFIILHMGSVSLFKGRFLIMVDSIFRLHNNLVSYPLPVLQSQWWKPRMELFLLLLHLLVIKKVMALKLICLLLLCFCWGRIEGMPKYFSQLWFSHVFLGMVGNSHQ